MSEGLKTLKRNTFCFSGIEEITLPDSVEVIEDAAFGPVNNLKTINLPKNLKTVGELVLHGDSLETITVPAEVELDESSTNGFSNINQKEVHVVQGSFMDENFDTYFPLATKVVE